MRNRKLVVALAVVLAGALAASAQAFGTRFNNLTFGKAVALPGVQLSAGTYRFERLETGGGNLVRVWHDQRVLYTGFTRLVDRPRGMDPQRTVVLGEAARGEVPPIEVWYPIGTPMGHQFIYPR